MNNKNDIAIKTSECLKYLIISSIMVFFIEFQVEASGSLEDKIKQAFTAYSQAQQATKREARMENFQRAFNHKGFEESMGKRYPLAELEIMILMK